MSTAFGKIGTDRQLQDHWLRRLIAGVIDSILLWIAATIILYFVPIPSSLWWSVPLLGNTADFVRGVLLFLYAAFLESTWGATIGKQFMNLKVTTTGGKLATLDKTIIRDISKIFGLLWLIDTLIGMATVGDPHQKYSDRYAGTTVVSTIERNLILPVPRSQPAPAST